MQHADKCIWASHSTIVARVGCSEWLYCRMLHLYEDNSLTLTSCWDLISYQYDADISWKEYPLWYPFTLGISIANYHPVTLICLITRFYSSFFSLSYTPRGALRQGSGGDRASLTSLPTRRTTQWAKVGQWERKSSSYPDLTLPLIGQLRVTRCCGAKVQPSAPLNTSYLSRHISSRRLKSRIGSVATRQVQ